MMISTSINKLSLFLAFIVVFSGVVLGSHYYSHSSGYSITGSTDALSVPEYDSQSEIATELVAPFIFIFVLLRVAFRRVLIFALAEDDSVDNVAEALGIEDDDGGDPYSREATLMALAVAGMMVPTPFWDWVRYTASAIGLVATGTVLLVILFLVKSFWDG